MGFKELFSRIFGSKKKGTVQESSQHMDRLEPVSRQQASPKLQSQPSQPSPMTHYKRLVIDNFAGEPSEADIKAIEEELGVSLPPDFVEFLKVANGGSTQFSVKVPTPDGEWIMMENVYNAFSNPKIPHQITFLDGIKWERESHAIPQEVFPFADGGGGSLFYLDLTPEGNGRVVVFFHSLPAWTRRRQEDEFIPLAASFTEFIDSLTIDPEVAEMMVEDAIDSQDDEQIARTRTLLDNGLPGWREIIGRDL